MNNYRALCASLLLALFSVHAEATPFNTLSMDVGVCDPNAPQNCIKPDASGNVPITGTISASLGGFTPSASGARMTPLSVTTSDSSGSLPTGAVSVVSNVGANPMYCNVNGVAATTSDQLIASNSWFAFTIPAAVTTLHCIATGGATTANGVGGAGLATGSGGGAAGGGGGGAITAAIGSYAAGALSAGAFATGAGVDGWDLTQGAKADAAWTTGSGSVISLLKAIAAAEIVTNRAVNVAQINGVAPLMGNGVTGTGSQRVTIASDNTAFSVNATLPAETTKNIGTIRITGNVGGVLDAIGQNVAAPANWLQSGCQFQTSPTTITAGNGSPFQCNNSGKLLTSDTVAQGSLATIATNSALPLPAQTGIGNANIGAVQSAGSKYIAVPAGATATVLQTSTGAAGDYLSHCVIYPTSTSPGVVTVFDNTNTAATSAILFAGGATSTSNLTPISVPVGAVSTAGAWKVTTGTAVSVVCFGKFS